jgi:Ras-related protein Rab-21
MTDPATFREVEDYWIQEARNNSDSDVLICLVGNKCDMPSQLEDSEVSQLSGSIGLPSYFVSAKTGEGVEKMFQEICERLIQTASLRRKNDQARLNQIQERKKGCCK